VRILSGAEVDDGFADVTNMPRCLRFFYWTHGHCGHTLVCSASHLPTCKSFETVCNRLGDEMNAAAVVHIVEDDEACVPLA
jgi:hypothetical protein